MSTVRLFLPSLVLSLWALIWTLGLDDDRVIGAGLTLFAFAYWIAERERRRRYVTREEFDAATSD